MERSERGNVKGNGNAEKVDSRQYIQVNEAELNYCKVNYCKVKLLSG